MWVCREIERGTEKGSNRKVQCEMGLRPLISSIQTRRAGLNYLQFSPSHHFPCWSLFLSSECVCASTWVNVRMVEKEEESEKGRGVCFQGQSVCGGCGALEIVGSLICNLISMALPLEVESIWFSALTEWLGWCVCMCVCLHCRRLNTYKAPLSQSVAFLVRHHGSVWLGELQGVESIRQDGVMWDGGRRGEGIVQSQAQINRWLTAFITIF